jgi:hypothetical protein
VIAAVLRALQGIRFDGMTAAGALGLAFDVAGDDPEVV